MNTLMRITRLFALSILILTTLVLGSPISAQDGSGQDEETEVPPIAEAFDEAFNAGEIDQLMTLFTDDAISIPPGAPRREGLEAVRADMEWVHETFDPYHETTLIEQWVSDEVIVEMYEYRETLDPVDGGEETTGTGDLLIVREQVDGEWKIALQIWNSDGESSEDNSEE